MANMREVNKAIKKHFADKDIEAVRGDGYIFFDGDDGFDKIQSIFSNPSTTSIPDMIRMVLDQISKDLHQILDRPMAKH